MATRATISRMNGQALVVSWLMWVVVVAVVIVACKCEAYEANLRHQNFGKYHASHRPSSPPPPPPSTLPYLPHITQPSSSPGVALAVEGIVVCQNCRFANTNSLLNSVPVQGAKVRLACRDMRFKTFVYETTITNKNGYFLFRVENFEFQRHKGVRDCRVVLVSSPNTSCARLTNVNSGKIGSPLTTRQKVYKDEILYSVGPFAFSPTPSYCYKH